MPKKEIRIKFDKIFISTASVSEIATMSCSISLLILLYKFRGLLQANKVFFKTEKQIDPVDAIVNDD